MALEQGPQGKRHLPAYRAGCYYNRPEDCCWLCVARIAFRSTTSPVRLRVRDAHSTSDHELVGERVVVPKLNHAADGVSLENTEGTIVEVHTLSGDDPDILTVTLGTETDEERYVHVDLTAGDLSSPPPIEA